MGSFNDLYSPTPPFPHMFYLSLPSQSTVATGERGASLRRRFALAQPQRPVLQPFAATFASGLGPGGRTGAGRTETMGTVQEKPGNRTSLYCFNVDYGFIDNFQFICALLLVSFPQALSPYFFMDSSFLSLSL